MLNQLFNESGVRTKFKFNNFQTFGDAKKKTKSDHEKFKVAIQLNQIWDFFGSIKKTLEWVLNSLSVRDFVKFVKFFDRKHGLKKHPKIIKQKVSFRLKLDKLNRFQMQLTFQRPHRKINLFQI